MNERQRVVVVGGGYAGAMAAARLVRNPQLEVTVVAPAAVLVHRVRLYRLVARRPDRRLAFSLTSLLGGRARVVDGRVSTVDVQARVVHTDAGPLPWDWLVVATGSVGLPMAAMARGPLVVEVEPAALADLRKRLPALAAAGARVLVVGAGTSAVELAATIAADWPGLRVQMVAPGQPLAALGGEAMRRAQGRLQQLGVAWVQGRVLATDGQGVRLDGGRVLAADVVVWAAGLESRATTVLANALPSSSSGEEPWRGDGTSRGDGAPGFGSARTDGRVPVSATLQLAESPRVFVVGDAAAVATAGGALPMGCKVALPMAAFAADGVQAGVAGVAPRPFAYGDPGTVVAMGGAWALMVTGVAGPGFWRRGAGAGGLVVAGRWVGLVKWLLCWYVVASIRLQASGWLQYRWLRRPLDADPSASAVSAVRSMA
jgi:NADH dehydrogenase